MSVASYQSILKKFIDKGIDKSILSKLLFYECYWNWIGHELDEKELKVQTDRYIVNSPNVNDEEGRLIWNTEEIPADAIDYEYNIYKLFGLDKDPSIIFIFRAKYYFQVIFWLIYSEKYEQAQTYIDNLYGEFIEKIQQAASQDVLQLRSNADVEFNGHPGFPPLLLKFSLDLKEIQVGYKYIFDGLRTFIKYGTGEFIMDADLVRNQPKFTKLAPKCQIFILYLKIDFLSKSRRYVSEIVHPYKLLTELDPECSDWFNGFYGFIRALRRQHEFNSCPDEKEINAAIKAYTLAPNNPFNLVSLCINAAEILSSTNSWPLEYNSIRFYHTRQMIGFITLKASEVMLQKPFLLKIQGSKPYLLLESIFSTILKKQYRNYEKAKECIDLAYEINPESNAIKHRKALLTLKLSPRSTVARNEAESLLRDAANSNTFRFNPLYDFILVLLADPTLNYNELWHLLSTNIKRTEHWNFVDISKLYFLKGCLNLFNTNYEEMIDNWAESLNLNSEDNQFKWLEYNSQRFSWNRKLFKLPYICKMLQEKRSISLVKVDLILGKVYNGKNPDSSQLLKTEQQRVQVPEAVQNSSFRERNDSACSNNDNSSTYIPPHRRERNASSNSEGKACEHDEN